MDPVTLFLIFCVVAGLVASFGMLVWPGIDNVPFCVAFICMFLTGMAGGAAITLILGH